MSASACEPLPRSTEIMAAFQAYQPKNGIHISSRFMMKAGSDSSGNSAKVSQNDWCLDETMSGPGGIFSRPRNSTSMPQTTRNSQLLERAQNLTMPRMPQPGISSVGTAQVVCNSRFRENRTLNTTDRKTSTSRDL